MPSSLDDYEVICTVGSGSYGICQKIRRKRDGKVLVWKELDYGEMSESEKQLLVSEVNLLRELKHEHIVRYYDRIIDRPHTRLYIIMEYCEGGDLSTLIASLKKNGGHCEEDFVWRICVQTVNALCECHSRSSKLGKAVLHRDLKPANVFLDANRNVKLGDFGLARVLNHDTSFAKTFVGTPYYMSPELMNYMSYNEKSDIWSLGCLLYELCALKPPFTASSQTELASKVRVGHFSRLPLRYSNDLNTVISFMLQVDEEKRPSVEALADHKLIVKHDPNRQHTLVASPPINGTNKTRPGSGASDEGYGSHAKSLKRREEMLEKRQEDLLARIKALEEKEKLLREREKASEDKEKKIMKFMLKEKELEAREKTVELREKMVDVKMAKVEKILAAADKSSLMSPRNGSNMTPSYTGSCSHMHCVDCSCTVDQLAAKTNSPHSAILLPAAKAGHEGTQDGQTGETEYFRRERLCSLENRTLAKRKDSEGRKKCVKRDGSVERRHHSRQGDSGSLLKRRDGSQENRRPLRLPSSHDVILQRERRHSEKEKYICDPAEKTKTPLIARKHCCRVLQMKDVAKNICPKASEEMRIDGLDGMRLAELPPVNVPKSTFGCGQYRL